MAGKKSRPPRGQSYSEVINEAVRDMSEHGYDSATRVAFWQKKIKEAAEREMGHISGMETLLREQLMQVYRRMIEGGDILRRHPGVSRMTIERIRPQLRGELDRRILAAADLIKLNRTEAVEKTLRRFAGWSTSIPKGGAAPGQKPKVKEDVKKALKQLPFHERRVLIDQGHKLTASLSEITAVDTGAIAAIWHSHWRQAGYDYREDHKERDELVYLMRGCWAQERGLVKPGKAGYYDQVTSVGEEPFCWCFVQWVYSPSKLPADMVTAKGRAAIEEARAKVKGMGF